MDPLVRPLLLVLPLNARFKTVEAVPLYSVVMLAAPAKSNTSAVA